MKFANVFVLAAGAAAAPNAVGRRMLDRSGSFRVDAGAATTSGNWAGAVLIGNGYTSVTGTIVIPTISRPAGAGAGSFSGSAWVGIDGDTCRTAILQTGVQWTIGANGATSYGAWYEWIPASSVPFSLAVKAGDTVRMTVTANSTSAGIAEIDNLTTGKSVSHQFSRQSSPLCETNAEWIVEAFQSGGRQVSLADFGTIAFTDVAASTAAGGTVTPASSTIINMAPGGTFGSIVTDCSASSSSVSCTYV